MPIDDAIMIEWDESDDGEWEHAPTELCEQADLNDDALVETQPIPPMPIRHKLYELRLVEEEERRLAHKIRERDEYKQREALLAMLKQQGEYRRLARIPRDWRTKMDELASDAPNFAEVIDYLRVSFAMAEYTDGVLHIEPLLLDGPPGAGKTRFVTQFARWFGSGFACLRMENAQTSSALIGAEEMWSHARPGLVFSILVEKPYANPVFLLDEIEKAVGDERFAPTSGLYSLFEHETAKTFHDLAHPWLTLDASRCLWMCTSNDYHHLPLPIQSRMRRFDIPAPTATESRQIAQSIFQDIVNSLPKVLHGFKLTDETLTAAQSLSPREIKKAFREAVARALYHGRSVVLPLDLPAQVGLSRRQIGFS